MIPECHGVRAPLAQGYVPIRIVDLDSSAANLIFSGHLGNLSQRADCFVIYKDVSAIMEIKSNYPEKAIPQLRTTAAVLRQMWSVFISAFSLPVDTPRPSAYYFVAEKGIGSSRYEAVSGILREKSTLGKGKGPTQMVDGVPINVYRTKDIQNEYNLYGVK